MLKIVLSLVVGVFVGVVATHFYYQDLLEESFFEGGLSESAAMAKKLSQLTMNSEPNELKKAILTVGCLSAFNALEQFNNYGVSFSGDHFVRDDAKIAYEIAKENGILSCQK